MNATQVAHALLRGIDLLDHGTDEARIAAKRALRDQVARYRRALVQCGGCQADARLLQAVIDACEADLAAETNHPEDQPPRDDIIQTRNEAWGFYGTYTRNAGNAEPEEADAAFDMVAHALMGACGITADQARDYLDSKAGRHLADEIVSPDGRLATFPRWILESVNGFLAAK